MNKLEIAPVFGGEVGPHYNGVNKQIYELNCIEHHLENLKQHYKEIGGTDCPELEVLIFEIEQSIKDFDKFMVELVGKNRYKKYYQRLIK